MANQTVDSRAADAMGRCVNEVLAASRLPVRQPPRVVRAGNADGFSGPRAGLKLDSATFGSTGPASGWRQQFATRLGVVLDVLVS